MVRIFRHLIDNALKFSPDGGEVIVAARAERNEVVIHFIDHGIGIDPAFMPRLFKRFERVETYQGHLFGGVGLGLPIVKHIVESHGGSIAVVTEVGQGSTFTVRLPQNPSRATAELSVDQAAWVDLPDDTPSGESYVEE
jgi:signal transduction histidine kinase